MSKATGIDDVGIEVVGESLLEFGVAFVLRIVGGLKEFGVAPRLTDIFGRAASGCFEQAGIKNAGLGIDEAFDLDRVLPAIAEV